MAKLLNAAEKSKFIKLIEENNPIWDLSNKDHWNRMVLAGSWRNVSEAMQRPVSECKTIYRSIRDGLRYRKKKQQQKSGRRFSNENLTPEESVADEDEGEVDWSLSLRFLEQSSSKRRTFSTSSCHEESCEPVLLESNYNYTTPATHINPEDNLTTALSEVLKLKRLQLDQTPQLKYLSMHMTLDRLYCQLSPIEVEELNHEFYNKTYEKVMSRIRRNESKECWSSNDKTGKLARLRKLNNPNKEIAKTARICSDELRPEYICKPPVVLNEDGLPEVKLESDLVEHVTVRPDYICVLPKSTEDALPEIKLEGGDEEHMTERPEYISTEDALPESSEMYLSEVLYDPIAVPQDADKVPISSSRTVFTISKVPTTTREQCTPDQSRYNIVPMSSCIECNKKAGIIDAMKIKLNTMERKIEEKNRMMRIIKQKNVRFVKKNKDIKQLLASLQKKVLLNSV